MTESVATDDKAFVTTEPIPTKPLLSRHTRRIVTVVSVVVSIVVLAALIALGYWLYTSYDRAAVVGVVPAAVRLRDIAFVAMALGAMVVILLALIVIVLLMTIIVLLYDRVIPVLEQTNRAINNVADTVHTVRGTTTFVSQKFVTPFIEVSSYAAGVARICKGVLELLPRKKAQVSDS